jgi:L-ascorbate metabolism protein UlaG (beta-lactamase superfamily)
MLIPDSQLPEVSVAGKDEPRFLRSNVVMEALVDRFYGWLHTVAPVQASMNLAFVQLPLLEAYLDSPQVHVATSRDPELRGGYFVNIDPARAGEVAQLVASIKQDRAGMLQIAAAIAEADELMRQNADGSGLSSLYSKLPAALNGLLEIAYDTNNQASIHFLEPLTYKSAAYDERRQSIQLSLDNGVERPFILSTPRLPDPGTLDLPLTFAHPGLTELAKARVAPTSSARLREVLELDDAAAAQLDRFLDTRPSLSGDRHVQASGRIRYFGNACLLLQTPHAAIITDPFISTDSKPGDRYTLDDLPDHVDLALITHGHQDHAVLETLLQLRGRVGAVVVPHSSRGNLADPSLALYLSHMGFPVVEANDFDEVAFPGGTVVATPFLGEHGDLDIRGKSTYWVKIGGRSVYIGADTASSSPGVCRYIRSHLGRVDVAFLSMECDSPPFTWLYQGLLTQPVSKKVSDSRRLSGADATQASEIMTELGASEAYVYAMGEERWQGHIMPTSYTPDSYQLRQIEDFLRWCADAGIHAEHLLNKREWTW